MLHSPRALIQLSIWIGDVVRMKGSGQELRREKMEMVFDGEDSGLRVQVVSGSSGVTTSGKS